MGTLHSTSYHLETAVKKHTPLALALAGLLAVSGIGTAIAVGDNEPPTPGQTLSDYMGDDNDSQWDKVQTWIEAEYGEGANPTPTTPAPTTPAPTTPAPEPTPPPTTGKGNTNGSGGAYTNRQFQSFSSAGMTSRYHVYAEGLDRSKPIGIMMYADGSGAHGFKNPGQSYLLGGPNGLIAVAKKHNLVLVVPEAPAPGCDRQDNCWYDRDLAVAANKATWSSNLMTQIKGQYPIDLSRVVVGGYSSGAQWTTQTFLPAHGANQSVDLAVAIAYGGAPRSRMNAPAAWKNDVVMVWDTGTADPAYGTAFFEARGGYNHYTSAGFNTHGVWPAGVTHSRGGQFGPIMDREISNRLR